MVVIHNVSCMLTSVVVISMVMTVTFIVRMVVVMAMPFSIVMF